MSEKQLVINMLFDDGVFTVLIDPPDGLNDAEFALWTAGANDGIGAYLSATQKDRNFIKTKLLHKHNFKFVEASEDDKVLYFYCVDCLEQGAFPRAKLN